MISPVTSSTTTSSVSFKVVIRAVKVADRVVPFVTSQLFLIQMRDVAIIVCAVDIKSSHDMLISELRRFVVMIQMLVCAKLGVRIGEFLHTLENGLPGSDQT